jgi:hypothetical protein
MVAAAIERRLPLGTIGVEPRAIGRTGRVKECHATRSRRPDARKPAVVILCETCGRYSVERFMAEHGDAS